MYMYHKGLKVQSKKLLTDIVTSARTISYMYSSSKKTVAERLISLAYMQCNLYQGPK